MKRLIPALAIVLGWALAAWAAPPAPLTTLQAIHVFSNDQASHALPVSFEATVTYYRSYEKTLFVQDGDVAIFVMHLTFIQLLMSFYIYASDKNRPRCAALDNCPAEDTGGEATSSARCFPGPNTSWCRMWLSAYSRPFRSSIFHLKVNQLRSRLASAS